MSAKNEDTEPTLRGVPVSQLSERDRLALYVQKLDPAIDAPRVGDMYISGTGAIRVVTEVFPDPVQTFDPHRICSVLRIGKDGSVQQQMLHTTQVTDQNCDFYLRHTLCSDRMQRQIEFAIRDINHDKSPQLIRNVKALITPTRITQALDLRLDAQPQSGSSLYVRLDMTTGEIVGVGALKWVQKFRANDGVHVTELAFQPSADATALMLVMFEGGEHMVRTPTERRLAYQPDPYGTLRFETGFAAATGQPRWVELAGAVAIVNMALAAVEYHRAVRKI